MIYIIKSEANNVNSWQFLHRPIAVCGETYCAFLPKFMPRAQGCKEPLLNQLMSILSFAASHRFSVLFATVVAAWH